MIIDLDVDCNIECSIVQPKEIFTPRSTIDRAVSKLLLLASASQLKLDKFMKMYVKNNGGDKNNTVVYSPGVKKKESAIIKVIDKYGGKIRQLKDIYRGAIIFNSMRTIKKSVKEMPKHLESYGFKVVRMDNTFDAPGASGYRDINFNISDSDNKNIIGELQLQYCPIKKFASLVGHKIYKLDHKFTHRALKKMADSKINELSSYGYNNAMNRLDPSCIADIKIIMRQKKTQKTRKTRKNRES